MTPDEMRKVAKALQDVSEAVRDMEDLMKSVKLERAIRRAAGELGDQAVECACNVTGSAQFMLDEWGESVGHVRMASILGAAAVRLRWRADVEERPDDLADLLADKLVRGSVLMPKDLLKELYLVGLEVLEVRGGKKVGDRLESLSMQLLVGAADWANRIDQARDAERDVLTQVAPF